MSAMKEWSQVYARKHLCHLLHQEAFCVILSVGCYSILSPREVSRFHSFTARSAIIFSTTAEQLLSVLHLGGHVFQGQAICET
jgi:hypothetical protein